MNILFTGRGTSGSWQVRGEQLGQALGAIVKPAASREDIDAADLVVLVKRPAPGMIDDLKESRTPWVWDLVDFYPQPACTEWSRDYAIRWVKKQLAAFRPDAVLWPNQQMRDDCGPVDCDTVLYHHGRPDSFYNPVRDSVRCIGYQGSRRYLGRWEKVAKAECLRRDWIFSLNNGQLADWEAVLAFRDRPFNGYVQRHWKSNIKLANCHITGTPFIGAKESGYLETGTGQEIYCSTPKELHRAFDRLKDVEERRNISEAFLTAAYSLEQAAEDLRRFLVAL